MKKLFLILALLPYFLLAQNVNQTIRADKVKVSAPSGRQSVTESDKFNAIVDMNTPSLVAPLIITTGIKKQGDLSDKISFTNLITYGNLPASGGEWNWGNATFSMARLNWSGLRLGYIEASPNLSPSATLDVFGTVRIRNNAANGRFFRSDASGYGTWQDVSFLSPSGGTMTGTLDVPRLRFTGNSILIGRNAQTWSNITGTSNILIGSAPSITSGQRNVITGYDAGILHTTGSRNTIYGYEAKYYTTGGDDNTLIGYQAGYTTGGNSNIAIGRSADITNGSFNVVIGNTTGLVNRNRHILLADGAGTERIRVDSVGNVGIANNSPTQRLTVSGNVLSNGFMVSGQTNSAFVKAGGGVDNTEYMPLFTADTPLRIDDVPIPGGFQKIMSMSTANRTTSGFVSSTSFTRFDNMVPRDSLTLGVHLTRLNTWGDARFGRLGSINSFSALNTFTGGMESNQITINGTGGNGFISFVPQSSSPPAPVSGFRLFANNSGLFSWEGVNGFVRTFDASSITANRTWTMKDASGNVPLESTVNTYTQNQIVNANLGINNNNPLARADVNGMIRSTGVNVPSSGIGAEMYVNGGIAYFSGYDRGSAVGIDVNFGQTGQIVLKPTGNVGIATSSPTSTLQVNGSQAGTLLSVSTNTTLAGQRFIIVTAAAALTLPTASTCTGRVYTINARAASVTISSYNDLSGSAQTTIASGTSITIVSDGTNWQRVQ